MSPENPSGEKGQGGLTNKGAKVNAFYVVAPGEIKVLFNVQGTGIINQMWLSGTIGINAKQRFISAGDEHLVRRGFAQNELNCMMFKEVPACFSILPNAHSAANQYKSVNHVNYYWNYVMTIQLPSPIFVFLKKHLKDVNLQYYKYKRRCRGKTECKIH